MKETLFVNTFSKVIFIGSIY